MEDSVNIHHLNGLYLMFIVAIRPLTILQALSSPCVVETCSKLSWGSEMLSFQQCRPEDSTVEVSETTALLFFSTVLDF